MRCCLIYFYTHREKKLLIIIGDRFITQLGIQLPRIRETADISTAEGSETSERKNAF